VLGVVFSPDGTRIATASNDTKARLWDAATAKPLGEPMKHDHIVSCVAFDRDGARIATASFDHNARLWATPLALIDDARWMAAFSEFRTRLAPDAHAILRPISDEQFTEAARIVFERPEYFEKHAATRARLVRTYHAMLATEYESDERWFAAAFNLKWLVDRDPHDKELRRRLSNAYAAQGLKEKAAAALSLPDSM